ncbi:MAG: hypothetical protein LBM93_14085 [Oscillospiraceae bacterium]|jgi:flagellin-like hook-associated protein FlgL|nr:hypothetical protein [Oscillospiraceae bacterium]
MRITQNATTRNYLARVNKTSVDFDKSMNRLVSGRGFSKMSENVVKGTRAQMVRSSLYRNAQYQENTQTTQGAFSVAEDNLDETKDLMVDAHALALRIQNGTFDQSQRTIVAEQFKTQMEQILKTGNAMYGDDYVFSGVKADDVPFKTGSYTALNKEPYFNDARVSDINKVVNFAEYFDVSKIVGLADTYPESLKNQTMYLGTWNEDGTVFSFKTDNGRIMTLEGNLDDGYSFYDAPEDTAGTREMFDLQNESNYITKIPLSSGFGYQSDPSAYTYYNEDLKTNVTQKLLDEEGNEWTRDGDGLYRNENMTVEYDDNGNCINYQGLTEQQIRNKTVYYDADHGNITEPTGFFKTDESGLMKGNYIRDNNTGYFYELNRDDGGLTYTNEFGTRIAATEDMPRYAVTKVAYSDDSYVDVGLGMRVSADTGLDIDSVIKSTVSGLDAYGYGSTNVNYSLPESVSNIPENERSMFRRLYDATGDGDGKLTFEISDNAYTLFETFSQSLSYSLIPDEIRSAYMTLPPTADGETSQSLISRALNDEIDPEQLSKDRILTGNFINDKGEEITLNYSTYDIYHTIKNYNDALFNAADTHLQSQTNKIVGQIADLGIRDKYLTDNLDRLENEELTLKELQQQIEGINDAEEITNLEMNEYAWTLTLKFGSQFLPKSLMDYVVM